MLNHSSGQCTRLRLRLLMLLHSLPPIQVRPARKQTLVHSRGARLAPADRAIHMSAYASTHCATAASPWPIRHARDGRQGCVLQHLARRQHRLVAYARLHRGAGVQQVRQWRTQEVQCRRTQVSHLQKVWRGQRGGEVRAQGYKNKQQQQQLHARSRVAAGAPASLTGILNSVRRSASVSPSLAACNAANRSSSACTGDAGSSSSAGMRRPPML